MKILFKNTTIYTKEEMDRFQNFHINRNKRKYILWLLSLNILFFILLILNLLYKNWYAIGGIIFIVAIMYAYYFRINPKIMQKNNKQQLCREFTFYFGEQYLEIKGIKENNKIFYYKFRRVYETKNNFYLYLDNQYSILINKNGFIIGSAEEFKKFIKKKLIFKYRLAK